MPHAQSLIFTPFENLPANLSLPEAFNCSWNDAPHPLSLLAAERLQSHLRQQTQWQHNFGLTPGAEGPVIGKMFGVLVVRTEQGALGYLSAFSGKLAGGNYHSGFVPPLYDGVDEQGFLTAGMRQLSRISEEIKVLEASGDPSGKERAKRLKEVRKNHSNALQQEIFEQYHFLNEAGESKSLVALFEAAGYKNPPAGAGECAAPKLLQYAFEHKMQPLAMAEFWWGLSPKSASWQHGRFYGPCREKCAPILAHMLPDLIWPAGEEKGL